jgi:hypothetical protein
MDTFPLKQRLFSFNLKSILEKMRNEYHHFSSSRGSDVFFSLSNNFVENQKKLLASCAGKGASMKK